MTWVIWLLTFFICFMPKIDAEAVIELAGERYMIASAFSDDILDARYRENLVSELKKANFKGVVLKDYELEDHYSRLKQLDPFNELSLEGLEEIGEKILLSFTDYLIQEGFDVGLYGKQRLDLVERGLVPFVYYNDRIYYGENLYYQLPLAALPHQDWYQAFINQKELLIITSKALESSSPFHKLSYISLESMQDDDSIDDIEAFRASLSKANLSGSDLDAGWMRLEEIAIRLERQKRNNMYTGILKKQP